MLRTCKIKTILILLGFVFGVASGLSAATINEYRGAYSGEVVWQGNVTMIGDVLILEGASLVIRPGTQVNVVPAEGTKIDPEYLSSQTELLVRGRLDIQGTAEAPVRFNIVENQAVEDIAWAGITLHRAADSSISHAVISRADTAIRCVTSSPRITGSKISGCRYGIIAQEQSHPEVIDNVLIGGEGGIFCWGGSNPYIVDNTITGHDEEALFVDAKSAPRLGANLVSENAIGLALYPRHLSFERVVSRNNLEDLRWLGSQGKGGGQ